MTGADLSGFGGGSREGERLERFVHSHHLLGRASPEAEPLADVLGQQPEAKGAVPAGVVQQPEQPALVPLEVRTSDGSAQFTRRLNGGAGSVTIVCALPRHHTDAWLSVHAQGGGGRQPAAPLRVTI